MGLWSKKVHDNKHLWSLVQLVKLVKHHTNITQRYFISKKVAVCKGMSKSMYWKQGDWPFCSRTCNRKPTDVTNIRLHSTEIHLFQKTLILISTGQQHWHLVTVKIQIYFFFTASLREIGFCLTRSSNQTMQMYNTHNPLRQNTKTYSHTESKANNKLIKS